MDKKTDRGMGFSESESQLILMEAMRLLLSDFRRQLLSEIRQILSESATPKEKQWLKSAEVRKLLGISHGTLQSLRNADRIPFTRIGGVFYYSLTELNKMLSSKTNHSY